MYCLNKQNIGPFYPNLKSSHCRDSSKQQRALLLQRGEAILQEPALHCALLLLLKMTVTWTLFSTTQWIFWFITFSLRLRAQYFPVRSFFFFFIPTFVVHLLGWDCRLGSAACNTYFSHFSVVIECSTVFCSFLVICYCSTPCLRLSLLFCVGSLLYTSFWAEAHDLFSLIILNRSRNRHMQYTWKPQCQCNKLIVINCFILSNMLHT